MDPDLTYLALAMALGLAMLLATAVIFTLTNGLPYAASPRDTAAPRGMPLYGQRLDRATKNLLETAPFAIAAILLAHIVGRHGALLQWGAALYFWGRVAHVLTYVAGVAYARTVAFFVSVAGIVLAFAALL